MAEGTSGVFMKHLEPDPKNPEAKLLKRDSGYLSPVTPGSTPDNCTPTRKTLRLEPQPQPLRSNSSPSTFPSDGESNGMQRYVQNQLPAGKIIKNGLKRQLSSPGALDGTRALDGTQAEVSVTIILTTIMNGSRCRGYLVGKSTSQLAYLVASCCTS